MLDHSASHFVRAASRKGRCTYRRVKESTTDAEEDPGVHCQRHTEAERDEEELRRVGSQVFRLSLLGSRVDCVRSTKGEE